MSTVLVGDPIDVITGVQFDVALDFRIAWPFPFEWRRFYSSARLAERLPLGWGHTHSYDHRLKFDVNGLTYVNPEGVGYHFPYPEKVGQGVMSGSASLRRAQELVYHVKARGHPDCEFHFTDPARPAQLRRVSRSRAVQELRYAADGRWTDLVHASEPVVGIESDPSGRIQALIWRGAREGRDRVLWEGKYDQAGNLVSVSDPYHTIQTFEYDGAHRMIGRRDRRGYGFTATYDAAGRCTQSAAEDGTQEVRLQFIPAESLTVVSRADGGAWQYSYQPEGITRIVDPYGGVTERIYGADGRLERELGPSGEVLREVVDEESGLLRRSFTPPNGVCLPLGDPWFEPVREVELPGDALGWEGYGEARCRNLIRFPSSNSDWQRSLPAAAVKGIRFAERREEMALEALAPSGGAAQAPRKRIGVPGYPGVMRHDPFGRLLSHTLPTGHSRRWQYDPNGNVVRYVDFAGSEWRYDYASWNHRVRETDPLGNATTYVFNMLERPTRVTDAGGTSTDQTYDLKDRLTERRRQDRPRDLYGYDRSEGLVTAGTGNGNVRVALALGQHRRPVEIAPAGQPIRRCSYDDKGRLVSVATDDGTALDFAYNAFGDLTADLQNGAGVHRRYEGDTLVACTVLEKFTIEYRYDEDERRMTIADPAGGRHMIQQLDTGVFLRRHANGAEELAQFDWGGRCLGKFRFRRNEPYATWSRVYRYSPVGALLTATDSGGGTSVYQYDAAHRLVAATGPDGIRAAFEYDGAGSLVASPGLEGVSLADNRIVAANGRRLEYNERHHLARESGGSDEREYEYDAEDRLASCVVAGERIAFRYDALGRRLAKVTDAGTTKFLWEGERLAAEISPGLAVRVYVYADVEARTPFAFIDYESADADPASGRRRYVFSDQIACPVLIEDDAGQVLWRAEIGAYGRATIESPSSIELNLRRPGHYFDAETGLHYNRHRYYSPELGRYIQVDPRDLAGGLNVYAYPARPLDRVDVDGLEPCEQKPLITPDENDPKFQKAKKKADEIADNLREALDAAKKRAIAKGEDPRAIINTTLTTMVILRTDGKYEVVVTGNRSDARLPQNVIEAMGDKRFIAHGDDRPPPVRQEDEDWRHPRTKADGTEEDSTHKHAEQRGLRATDCDKKTEGVAYIAPTRPCCKGCSSAIQDRGGTSDNVSDLGTTPGAHGDHWDPP